MLLRYPVVQIREKPARITVIPGAPTSVAAFVGHTVEGPLNEARQVNGFAAFEKAFGGLHADSPVSWAVHLFFLNGGRSCWIVRTPDSTATATGGPTTTAVGSRHDKTGIYALDAVEIVNILCLPDVHDVAALAEAITYAEARRSMVIVDIDPVVDTVTGARDWAVDPANEPLMRSHAAAYFPRVQLADPLAQGQVRSLPNCGVIAGLWARTDRDRGVWKAPAGTEATLQGVQGLDTAMSDAENSLLNPLGLNCLRRFPATGLVSWGARTLAGADARASEWKYVPVRRTALFIEESLRRGLGFAAYEPNGEPLWARIRQAVDNFMQTLFRQGAFRGSSQAKAYFVRCDSRTTTQADVLLGHVNVQVGFALVRPGEFVVLRIRQRVRR